MPAFEFKATLFALSADLKMGTGSLLALPKNASAQLPSRGMCMVKGTINDLPFHAAVEPDGNGSHWFRVDEALLEETGAKPGDTLSLSIETTKEWPEPRVPADLQNALAADSQAQAEWTDITPMARWDWIRWISACRQEETRKRRVEVTCSKLRCGKRRACCFDRTQCTLTDA